MGILHLKRHICVISWFKKSTKIINCYFIVKKLRMYRGKAAGAKSRTGEGVAGMASSVRSPAPYNIKLDLTKYIVNNAQWTNYLQIKIRQKMKRVL